MLNTPFELWALDNELLVEEVGHINAEVIFEAGRLVERENVLDLISRGVLTHNSAKDS